MPQLLDLIDVEGAIVTANAMSCQKTIVEKIIESKAEYKIGLLMCYLFVAYLTLLSTSQTV